MHRWTAIQLHRRLVAGQRGEEIADAHRRAAEYWRWRISSWPHDRQALHEASYHLLQAEWCQHGQRGARPGTRRRLLALGAAAVAVAVSVAATAAATGAFSAPARVPGQVPAQGTAAGTTAGMTASTAAGALAARSAAVRTEAAAWVARQVSRDAIMACDPAMCAALQARGIPPGNLLALLPSSGDPLGSDLVLATPAVRSQFGGRLAGVYAPVVIASFGSGDLRIDVRAVAPDGAAAYRAALAADLSARRAAGRQLLQNPAIRVPPVARADLAAGRVDSRLLLTLAAVASAGPVRIVAFTDSGPGAAPGVPLRAVELTVPSTARATPRPGATPRAGTTRRAGRTPGAHATSTGTPGAAPGIAVAELLAFARAAPALPA